MDFFGTCRDLFHRPAIYNVYILCTHTFCTPRCIHGNVSATDYRNVFCFLNRGIVLREISLHQIDPRQIFIGRAYTQQILTRNIHKGRKSCTCSNEYCLISVIHKIIHRLSFTDDRISHKSHTAFFQLFHFCCYDALRQTKFRNTVSQYTTRFMQAFKDCYIIALCCQVTGTCKSCRTCSYNSHLGASRKFCSFGVFRFILCRICFQLFSMSCIPVCDKAFQTTDSNRFAFFPTYAVFLTLIFLRANSTAYTRQRTCRTDHLISALKVALCNLCNEFRDPNHDRTSMCTWLFPTVETAHRFVDSHLWSISL